LSHLPGAAHFNALIIAEKPRQGIVLVAILKGAFMFLSDLCHSAEITWNLASWSYGSSKEPPQQLVEDKGQSCCFEHAVSQFGK